jgi:hypothetical protein
LILLAFAGGGYYLYQHFQSFGPNPCDQAMSEVNTRLQTGNTAAARSKSQELASVCTGDKRPLAKALADSIERATACERKFSSVNADLAAQRLESANRKFARIDASCRQGPYGLSLQSKLSGLRQQASDLAAEVRRLIARRDMQAAGVKLDRLRGLDGDFAELAQLKQELAQASLSAPNMPLPTAPTEQPATPAATRPTTVPPQAKTPQAPVLVPFTPDSQTRSAPTTQSSSNTPAPLAEMVSRILSDAEAQLKQKQFDRAKGQVQAALNIDRNSAAAQALLKRINEEQLQYLRDETVIH